MPDLPQSLLDELPAALGVTRVARVTSLDRAGVEVACAVRPGGHVLQVCNGKGLDWEGARLGALLETAELHASEHPDPATLRWSSAKALERRAGSRGRSHAAARVLGAEELGSAAWVNAPELLSDGVSCAWVKGRNLVDGSPVFAPAQALYCPPPGSVDLGAIAVTWTTNGMGAHPVLDRAVEHALLEAAERDQLARVLPDGWTVEVVLSRALAPESIASVAPRASQLVQQISSRGFDVRLYDLSLSSGPGALGLPVAGALLFDAEGGPIPVTAGYACRRDPESALIAALTEAAQSRLTDIHGAREDVARMARAEAEALASMARSAGAVRRVDAMPRLPVPGRSNAAVAIAGAFRRAGCDCVGVFELSASTLPVRVVKVVVPGFLISELLA